MRCCVKLLASCGSKQKNFLATHHEQLRSAIDTIVLDIELVNLKSECNWRLHSRSSYLVIRGIAV